MDTTKIVQETVKYAVATVTSKIVTDLATKHTDINEIAIKVGSYATGAMVADALKTKTDAAVVFAMTTIRGIRKKNQKS